MVVASGTYILNPSPHGGGQSLNPDAGALQEMRPSYGTIAGESLALVVQNEPFPMQVERELGDIRVREYQALDYPFFVDVRPDGMDRHSPILASLTAVTLNWTSPVVADPENNGERELTTLLMSSPGSWLRTDVSIQPDLQTYPELGFPVEGEQMRHPLAVSVRGSFESYFKGKPSPLEGEAEAGSEEMPVPGDTEEQLQPPTVGTIETSPDATRLVVIGSAEFLNDIIFDLSSALAGDRYLNSLQFAQNAVDWCVEDLDLLTIRSRGTASRVLIPLTEGRQSFWEGLNYVLALLAVVGIAVLWRLRKRNERPMDLVPQVVPDDAEEARS